MKIRHNTKIFDKSEKNTVREIVTLHSEICGLLKTSLEKAVRIGELLTEQKANLKHGEFGSWIKANLPFTDRTVRNYMSFYRNRELLKTESVSDLTGAYRLIGKKSKVSEDFQERLSKVETPEECLSLRDEILKATQNAAEQLLYAEAELATAKERAREVFLLFGKKIPKPVIPANWDYDTSHKRFDDLFQELAETSYAIGKRIILDEPFFGKPEYGNKTLADVAKDTDIPEKALRQCLQFAKSCPDLTDFSTETIKEKLIPDEFMFADTN